MNVIITYELRKKERKMLLNNKQIFIVSISYNLIIEDSFLLGGVCQLMHGIPIQNWPIYFSNIKSSSSFPTPLACGADEKFPAFPSVTTLELTIKTLFSHRCCYENPTDHKHKKTRKAQA